MDHAPSDHVRTCTDLHVAREFPSRLRERLVSGTDVVMLDADIVGLVHSWLAGPARFPDRSVEQLRRGAMEAGRLAKLLSDPVEIDYLLSLRDLAEAAADGDGNPSYGS